MYTQADLNTFNLSYSQTPPRPSIHPSLSRWYITQASLTMCLNNVPARPQSIILTMSSVYSSRSLAHRTDHRLTSCQTNTTNVCTFFNPTFILSYTSYFPLKRHQEAIQTFSMMNLITYRNGTKTNLMERSGQIRDKQERQTEYKQNHIPKFNLSSF